MTVSESLLSRYCHKAQYGSLDSENSNNCVLSCKMCFLQRNGLILGEEAERCKLQDRELQGLDFE